MDFNSLVIAIPTLVTGLALTELLRRRRKAARSQRVPARIRKESSAQQDDKAR